VIIDERVVAQGGGKQTPPEARGVGLMFQDYALFPHLTIRDNVTFGISARAPERRTWVERGIERMGLGPFAETYPHTLSGGQQQRVALLRALAPGPRVMLLDEPFSGLDVGLRAQVRDDTLGLLKETGVATLMVTHDPEEAMLMADRLFIMNDGRIVQAGTPVEVYFQPTNAFVAQLFGPVNRLEGRALGGRVETPLGVFAAPGLADGAAVQILIRIEGLRAGPPGSAPPPDSGQPVAMRVLDARSLGRASVLHLAFGNGRLTLLARVPGVFLPEPDQPVLVWTNPAQTFVFPA
jgi:iron(III) transport system ATP-binding protein